MTTIMQPLDATPPDRLLNFSSVGMWWQITRSTTDTRGDLLESIQMLAPGFQGPPLHIYPQAEERFKVLEGTLDVCLSGEWRQVGPGEMVTVAPGVSHTLKNRYAQPVRLINVHRPALGYERFYRRLQLMLASGKLTLPPRGIGSRVRLSMLVVEHEREIQPANISPGLVRFVAFLGSLLGYKLID